MIQDAARNSSHMNVVSHSMKSQLFIYYGLPLEDTSTNIIEWWEARKETLPTLFNISRFIHSIPATSVSSESAFSSAGNLLSKSRSNLDPSLVNKLVFLKSIRGYL